MTGQQQSLECLSEKQALKEQKNDRAVGFTAV